MKRSLKMPKVVLLDCPMPSELGIMLNDFQEMANRMISWALHARDGLQGEYPGWLVESHP